MKRIYFTPGPTQLHPLVPGFIAEALATDVASISHRSRQFEGYFEYASENLRVLMNIPATHSIFFLGTATESWERIIENTVLRRSFHFVNGAFSERFRTVALELGREPYAVNAELGMGIDLLSAAVPEDNELLCVTHNETSTGVSTPVKMIHALARKYPQQLIAVDAVSSAPHPKLDMSLIDALFFSVQKCFGLPAGLGVLIVSPRALERANELRGLGHSTGSYHSFQALKSFADKEQTPATPNVLAIYLLGRVADALQSQGIDSIRASISARAKALYNALDSHPHLEAVVSEARFRSETVIAVNAKAHLKAVVANLAQQGFVVGDGYGALKSTCFRVANFPCHTDADFYQLIEALRQFRIA